MFSRIEPGTARRGEEPAAASAAEQRRTSRPRWWSAVCAALLGVGGCSGTRDELIATITVDAAVRDAERCVPIPVGPAIDMGLDLYFVLERSRNTGGEWTALNLALGQLFSPGNKQFAGIGLGVAVYPKQMPIPQSCLDNCSASADQCDCLWDCGCRERVTPNVCADCSRWDTSCNENDYGPSSEITRLNEHPDGFLAGLVAASSDSVTVRNEPAAFPALVASRRDLDAWELRHQRRRRAIQVLVAKSLDSDCPDDRDSDFARVVGGGDKPKTYVVALNLSHEDRDDTDELEDLDALAAIGGTDEAIPIPIGFNPAAARAELERLIEKIRAIDGRCEYLLPDPSDFDPKHVNLTASSSGLLYSKVANRAACASNPLGWYYDSDDDPANPAEPKRILACDGACKSLHGQDVGSGIANIELGCPTVMARDAGAPVAR
jgi:hypothetical protein